MKRAILVLAIFMTALGGSLFAQDDAMSDEAMETLRFIRLAETKKNLNLDEAKLLRLNEMLDDYEARRFEMTRRQMRLHRKIKMGFEPSEAEALLKNLRQVREGLAEIDDYLWNETEKILDPTEAIQFFQFYSNFQNEVRRRIRALRGGDRQKQRNQQPFRRNKNRQRPGGY